MKKKDRDFFIAAVRRAGKRETAEAKSLTRGFHLDF